MGQSFRAALLTHPALVRTHTHKGKCCESFLQGLIHTVQRVNIQSHTRLLWVVCTGPVSSNSRFLGTLWNVIVTCASDGETKCAQRNYISTVLEERKKNQVVKKEA